MTFNTKEDWPIDLQFRCQVAGLILRNDYFSVRNIPHFIILWMSARSKKSQTVYRLGFSMSVFLSVSHQQLTIKYSLYRLASWIELMVQQRNNLEILLIHDQMQEWNRCCILQRDLISLSVLLTRSFGQIHSINVVIFKSILTSKRFLGLYRIWNG